MSSVVGRAIIVTKTNKSGGALAKGDVVIVDSSNDNAVTTTTSGSTTVTVGVVVEENGIANNASGRVQFGGHCGLVTPNASVTRGHYAATHTVAKQCADAGASRVVGAFGIFTTGGTTPEIDLFSQPDASSATGNVATDAIWDAKGDLAAGTGANTAAKVTVGANDTVLIADSTQSTGVKWSPLATILRAGPTGDTTLTTANTWYDVCSLVLGAAPFYQVLARAQILVGGSNGWGYLRLIDGGSAVFGAGEQYSTSATSSTAPINAWGVVAGSQTIKLQASASNNTATANRYPQDTGPSGISTSPITQIIAIPSTA